MLNGGLNTKFSGELADPTGSMAEVNNLRWNRLGELEKRPTYATEAVPGVPANADYGSVTVEALFARRGEVVALTDNYGFATIDPLDHTLLQYARRDIIGSEVSKYAPRACRVSRRALDRAQFGRNEGGIDQVVSALYGEVLVVAWVEHGVTPFLMYKAVHAPTGATVARTKRVVLATSSTSFPSVQAVPCYAAGSEGVLITYASGLGAPFTIHSVLYNAATRVFADGPDLVTTAKVAAHSLAGRPYEEEVYLMYIDNAASVMKCHFGTAAEISGGTSVVHTGVPSGALYPGAICLGSTEALLVTHASNVAYAERFGDAASYATIMTAPDDIFFSFAAAQEFDNNTAVVWANAQGGPSWRTFSRVRSAQVDFSAPTPVVLGQDDIPYAWIATGGFSLDGRAYVGVSTSDPVAEETAASILVVRHHSHRFTGNYRNDPVARICHDQYFSAAAAGLRTFNTPAVDGKTVYITVPGFPSEDAYTGLGGPLSQLIYQSTLTFCDTAALPLPSVEHDGTLLVASGLLVEWDGDTPTEHATVDRPRAYHDTTASGTTTTTDKVYARAIWRWVDAQGKLHRSAPSNATEILPFTSKRLDVYVSKPPFAACDGSTTLQTLEPELYITADGGAVFYLANEPDGEKMVYTSNTIPSVQWKFEDVKLGNDSNPQLYSTGEGGTELVPEPPPSFRDVTRVGDRLFAIDAEDTTRVWFTKPFAAGYPPEWTTSNTLIVGDDCVAVRDLGGVPTVFGATGVHQIYGEGPDALGVGFFAPARRLPHDVDCIDPRVCSVGFGILFRARKGFYVLGNGGDLQPIGLPVDALARVPSAASYKHMKAVFHDLANEVRILDAYSVCQFLLSTLDRKWATWTQDALTQYAVDLVVADGRVWYVQGGAPNTVRREYGVDELSPTTEGYSLTTHWTKPDGLVGHGRLWRVFLEVALMGSAGSIETLRLDIYNDFKETIAQTVTWSGPELLSVWGTEAIAKLSVVPERQIVTAVKFRVSCTFSAASVGPRPLTLRLSYGARISKGKRAPGVK